MVRIWKWFNGLSNRARTSFLLSVTLIGLVSTIMSIIGVSLETLTHRLWLSLSIIFLTSVVLYGVIYWIIGLIFKYSLPLTIHQNSVLIANEDIFDTKGWIVIGCDTHFDTRVDDVVISKKSLHGKLLLEHGEPTVIKQVVEQEALRRNLSPNSEGLYDFALGTIIRYDSAKDGNTYLLLAMTELNEKNEAHTNMTQYEQMLMTMWMEINSVYAGNDIVLPVLGTGITRFEGGPQEPASLLRCMLCTLNASGVYFNSEVKIVINGNRRDIPLYEYKDLFRNKVK